MNKYLFLNSYKHLQVNISPVSIKKKEGNRENKLPIKCYYKNE